MGVDKSQSVAKPKESVPPHPGEVGREGRGGGGTTVQNKASVYSTPVPSLSEIKNCMRVAFWPNKITGSWMNKTGSWEEATLYYTDILTNVWQM